MTGTATASPRVCVDANLVLNRLLPHERDPQVLRLWADWAAQGFQVLGPPLLFAEVASTLRMNVARGRLPVAQGDALFAAFTSIGIQRIDRDDLYPRAWDLAKLHNQPRAYDMLYLALAQLEDIELWTNDQRLVNSLTGHEPRVRLVPLSTAPPRP